ncbi:uncharacterized protein LOC107615752 [Arachis ipaensis]|uniref:uncharacterized protein LOC107615752 n=1 Tax=Arachis ipaensis TaxID=130454 RepID=UPI0007AF61A7|nr:uncharacterized protein LOC107615752 [Arachis ipaensis]XP_025678706.1 uncharacterized protein LOC112778620 [Arachis hypogaea]
MLIDSAAGNEILSFMDSYSGYNQIFIAEEDVAKNVFRCPGALGTYEWVVMPFGLKNVGATYQWAMNAIFHEFIGKFMEVYIDDVMVKSISVSRHIDHLRRAFLTMRKKGLKMNPLKCSFGVSAGNFLGFAVHKKGIAIDKNKADAILALSAPKSKKEVQSFLEHQLAFDSIKTYLSKAPIMANLRPSEPLKLYIAASENTIGHMLAQDDENGHERAVYYLSQVLTDIETSFPMLRGRLEKWMLALTEFDLQYVPAKAVKGQVIADFLVDNSKDLNDQGANVIEVKVDYWKLYFDESKHKDGAGVGILIVSPEGIPSKFLFEIKYPYSNNEAEYEALILGLKILINKGVSEVQILGDSQLVLKQLSKEFKCNNERLQKYLTTAWELLTSFQKISLVHNPRIQNEMANELAQIALKYKIGPGTLETLAGIHQILVPAGEREVLCVDEWEDIDWRKPIAQYLKDPSIPVDRKMKLRATNFV